MQVELTLAAGILVIILALAFAFSTGFNDAANVVAVVISTKVLSPRKAVLAVGVLEFIGAYFLGTAVAETMGTGVVDPNLISGDKYGIIIILATLLGATLWNVICTILGFPVSASHALVGGFAGAGVAAAGFGVVQWINVFGIFLVLLVSPVLGLATSFALTKFTNFVAKGAKPAANKLVIGLEIFATIGSALATGANAAQRPMGIIVFSLIVLGLYQPATEAFVPTWVVVTCGMGVSIGVFCAGKNVVKTVGMRYYRLRHINGFSAQAASASVIQLANIIGSPVSTTQVTSGAVMGTGAAERIRGVRWSVGTRVFLVWLITMPSTAVACGLLYWLILNIVKFFTL